MNERNERRAAGGAMPPRGGARGAWRRTLGVVAAGIGLAGFAGGCASGVAESAPVAATGSRAVRLTLANEAARAWAVSIYDPDGFEVKQVRLRAREETTVELAGGDYTLEQALLGASGSREAVRRLPLRLKAGGSYTWTLATLLGDPAVVRGEQVARRD